jgi:uncharacterized damage-inducible protein DinB
MTLASAPGRPDLNEFAPYFEKYIDLVPDGDIVSVLENQARSSRQLLQATSEERGNYAYAPGKWTLKEVLGHLTDSERIFAYRLLRIARNDRTAIEGFEQDDYVLYGSFGRSKLADLVEDFAVVRQSSLRLLRSLDEPAWLRRGVANNNEVSVRALAYMIAGHELHHLAILKVKYLSSSPRG